MPASARPRSLGLERSFLITSRTGFAGFAFLGLVAAFGLLTAGSYVLFSSWSPAQSSLDLGDADEKLSLRENQQDTETSEFETTSLTLPSPENGLQAHPGYVVSVNENGEFILVPDAKGGSSNPTTTLEKETMVKETTVLGALPYFTLKDQTYGLHTTSPNAYLHIAATNPKTMGLIVRGAALQSTNLTEWQNSDGNGVAWITPDGGAEFNVQGKDTDFRVKSSNSAQALFIEGNNGNVGLGTETPDSRLVVEGSSKFNGAFVLNGNSSLTGNNTFTGNTALTGLLTLRNSANDTHLIELYPTGNTGYLNGSGGAFYIDNTNNIGAGYLVYSNAGAEAEGNLLNVKVDNAAFNQAGFYISYDGSSNGVEIVSNANDTSSNALSVTGNNVQDSTVGIIGYESNRGTVKISHFKPSTSDANASAISIDLKGDGTAAQGLYIDSTATTGTTGNLVRLRNQTIDRFVINSLGSVTMGSVGTNTSFTKLGNNTNDHFFIGTTGSFRVQRSANDSETFRVQIAGDANGRWLGTSDGKLKWGDGTNTQDSVLRRLAANTLLLDNTRLVATSSASTAYVASFANTGATAASYGLLVKGGANDGSGTTYYLTAQDGAGNVVGYLQNSGGNFTVNDPSDIRTKTNIRDTELNGLDIVSSLRVVDFNRKSTPDGRTHHGFIAQEVQSVFPYMVSEDPSGMLTISKESLIPVLVKAVQQQQLEITSFGELAKTAAENAEVAQLQLQEQSSSQVSPEEYVSRAELSSLARWSFEGWEWIKNVVFSAPVQFREVASFGKDLVVHGRLRFADKDTAGFAVLQPGQQEVRVQFERPFAHKPVLQALPESFQGSVSVRDVSETAFTLVLSSAASSPVTIHWTAWEVESARTTSSEFAPVSVSSPLPSPSAFPNDESIASSSAQLQILP